MQPIKTNTLTKQQIADIKVLHEVCTAEDGLTAIRSLDCSINYNSTLPAFYLQYEENRLVSFLMIFMPVPSEAELIAMTHPSHRGQGHFLTLLREASRELMQRGLSEALIQCEPQSKAGIAALKHLGGEYVFSEYTMYRPLEQAHAPEGTLLLKPASPDDLEVLSVLAGEIFQEDASIFRSWFGKSFASDEISVLEAWQGGRRVGLCRIVWSDTPPNICTFGIHPVYRKQGFGKEFLRLVLEHIAKKGYQEAALDVNSQNGAAFRLYQRMGFTVHTQVDYYELPLPGITGASPLCRHSNIRVV